MRLVTYQREGERRLGAYLEDVVIDLPDAVGHPAFPRTMEALVARNGGTTLDAAREAFEHDDVMEFAVDRPRLLVPLLPASLRSSLASHDLTPRLGPGPDGGGSGDPRGALLGPGAEVPWPGPAEGMAFDLRLACVVGRAGRDVPEERAGRLIFGYTILGEWSVPDVRRNGERSSGPWTQGTVAAALGPCVVTADDLDLSHVRLIARVDGEERVGATLVPRGTFPRDIARASRDREVGPGEVFASAALDGSADGRLLEAGAVVELEATGIGRLEHRLGERP